MKLLKGRIYPIMYHFIHDKSIIKNIRFNSLKIKEFSKQISYLKKKTNIIGLDDLEDIITNKKILNKPSTLLTFDDGYKDHYDIVLPILVKNKITGIFFPPTDIFEDKILDVNKIHCILGAEYNSEFIIKIITDYLNKKKINIKQLIKKFNIDLNSRFDDKQTILVKRLLQFAIPQNIRSKLINLLFKKIVKQNINTMAKKIYMSENNIKELINHNMEIGIQGQKHYWWNKIKIYEKKREIIISKIILEKKFAINCRAVCYPYGAYDDKVIEILKNKNIKFGFTTKPGHINYRMNNLLINRYDCNDFKF